MTGSKVRLHVETHENGHVLLQVRANGESLGDDTDAVVARPKGASEHGPRTESGPLCRWVASLAHR